MSEQLLPEEIGYVPMVEKVAAAVRVAMERAGITDPADVHYVQTKTPLLTIHTIRDAKSRGKTVWTEHTHESMDLSNGCTALGIAVALGEIEMPTDADVMHNRSLYSSVASCSSGVELDQAQVVVVGNARGVGGRYRIGHSVMQDALDQDGIWAAIKDAGLDLPERPHRSDLDGRLVNVFLKCEASLDGQVAGRRNAMLDDSDVHWHRQIKSCVGGVTASVTGDPAVFVSVSAAHQGPDGGGPVAAIVDLGAGEPTGYRPPDRLTRARPVGEHAVRAAAQRRVLLDACRHCVGGRLAHADAPRSTASTGSTRRAGWRSCRCSSRTCARSAASSNVTEYLTAPLFAVVIGDVDGPACWTSAAHPPARSCATTASAASCSSCSASCSRRCTTRSSWCCPTSGCSIIVLAPLALLLHRMPVLTLGVAAGLAVVEPARHGAGPRAGARAPRRRRRWSSTSSGWLAAGYVLPARVAPAMALGGLALATRAPPGRPAPRGRGSSAACSSCRASRPTCSARRHPTARPRTPARPRRSSARRSCPAARWCCRSLCCETLRDLGAGGSPTPCSSTGRLALTAYTLQILWLALLSVLRDGAPDDAWWILGSSHVVVVGRAAGRSTAGGAPARSSGSSTASGRRCRRHRTPRRPARRRLSHGCAAPPPRHAAGPRGSVGEVPRAGEVHRDARGLRGLDHLGVAHRPTRGHDRAHAGVEEHLEPVGEGEEGVGCRDGTARPLLTGPRHGEVARVDPVDLAHADADRGAAAGEQDGVRLHRAHRAPGELEVGEGGRRRRGRPETRRQCAGVVAAGHRAVLALDDGVDGIPVLHEQAAADRADLGTATARGRALEEPDVLLRGEHLEGVVVERRARRRPR